MNIFIYILFFSLSLGQLGRISFANQAINIYFYEIVMGFMVTLWINKYGIRAIKEKNGFNNALFVFFGILIILFLASMSQYAQGQNIIAGLYMVRLLFYFFYFIYLSYVLKKNAQALSAYKRAIPIFIIVTGLSCLVQYFFYPNLRNLSYLGWDPHQHRVFGLFFDTSIAAAIVGLIILYLTSFIKKTSSKVGLVTFLILGLLTYSRAFYLSLIVTCALFLIKKGKYLWISVLLGGAALSFFMLPRPQGEGVNLLRSFSIESRKHDYKEALQTFSKKPIFGIGYNHIQKEAALSQDLEPKNHSNASYHSSFLIVLVTTGIVGLVSFIFLLYRLARISEMSQMYVIYLSIFSLFDNIILHPFVLLLFLSLIALEYKYRQK